jgi:hypothetical protein
MQVSIGSGGDKGRDAMFDRFMFMYQSECRSVSTGSPSGAMMLPPFGSGSAS